MSTSKDFESAGVIGACPAATRIIMLILLLVAVWADVHCLTNRQLGYLALIKFLAIALGTAGAQL